MAIFKNKKCEKCDGVLLFNDNGYSVMCENCNEEYLLSELNKINVSNKNQVDTYVDMGKSWSLSPDELKKNIETALKLKDFYRAISFCNELKLKAPNDISIYIYQLLADLKISEKIELGNVEDTFFENQNYKLIMEFGDEKLKEEMQSYCNQNLYNQACRMIENKNYTDAKRIFLKLKDFSDSEQKRHYYMDRIKEIDLKETEMRRKYEQIITERENQERKKEKIQLVISISFILPIIIIAILFIVGLILN